MVTIQFKKLHDEAIIPTQAYDMTEAGFDIYSLDNTEIYPGERKVIHTGLASEIVLDEHVPKNCYVPWHF